MKKLLIVVIIILIAFSGFTLLNNNNKKPADIEDNPNDTVEEDKTPPVESLITNFNDRVVQNINENGKVVDYNNKEELINYISQVSNNDIAKQYVDLIYIEKEDGLYLNSELEPLLINLYNAYNTVKESDEIYNIIQNGENDIYGKYDITMTLQLNNNEWLITNIVTNTENVVSNPSEVNNKDIDYTDVNSILVLANKQHSLNPSNYKPKNLVNPNIPFVSYMGAEVKQIEKVAADALEELVKGAKEENIEIYGRSGYRSYETQEILFNGYVKKNGYEEAVSKSAFPGHSEHQTGLAIDVTSPSVDLLLTQSYGKTKEGIWLKENAHKYGFIIRYPEGKEDITGYIYEPWHIRYVGKEVATEIYERNITFEEYLGVE